MSSIPRKSVLIYEFLLAMLLIGMLVLSLAAICLNRKAPRWDGTYYFATLRSVYFDRDIDFNNEGEYFIWMQRYIRNKLPNEMIANPFALGSAILWSPFYAAADLYCSQQPGCVRNGYHHLYAASVLVGTVFWVCMGCILNAISYYRLASRTRAGLSVLTVVSLALGSALIFYALFQGDYSHGNAYFSASLLLFVTVWLMEQKAFSLWHYFVVGLTIGLVFLVRWQDILFGILPLGMLVYCQREQRSISNPRAAGIAIIAGSAIAGLGLLLAAMPQMIFWKVLYGSFFTLPQTSYAPEFISTQYLSARHVLEYYFSTWNGVFLWHPILLIGMAGLVIYPRRFFTTWGKKSQVLRWLLLMITMTAYIAGLLVIDWWSGGSFGQRRLVSVYPFIGIGLLYIFHLAGSWRWWARWSLAGLVVVLITWNSLTMVRYHQGRLPFNPSDPNWYASQQTYGHFDYAQRFSDVLLGRQP